jgi:hypothetical protein
MLRSVLILAAALGCFSLAAVAQTQPDKKADVKGKEDPKSKAKDAPKAKVPLDQMKLPKDAVVVVVDNLLDALAMFPNVVVLSADKFADLQEQIRTLKQQLKENKKTPFSCKLHGRLEDDFLIGRAEFLFSTEQPKTIVPLGLLGGHLLSVGELDNRPPILEMTDDGFSVRVEKEGDHQLVLNFRVPASVKKSTTGGVERGIKLGLAETAVTIVNVELPANVKELRCNDALEKTKTPGRWLIGLEKSKGLNLAWKEPAPLSGNAAPKAEGQIAVRIDDKDVNISARLFMQDTRLQTKEWRIVTPANAKVEVETPPSGLTYELLPPEGKGFYTLKTAEATAERWQVSVSLSVPRPNPGPRVPIGPLQVLGAQQTGTITVTMPANVSFGQRLVFPRTDALRQLKNTETEAVFEYVLDKNPKPAPNLKAPLELEWRFEKNQAKTEVEHLLKLRAVNQGWEIDATTRIKVTALFSAVNAVDVKLPQPYPRGMALIGTAAPGLAFPGNLPWTGMWKTFGMPWTYANPDDFTMFDEAGNPLKPALQDPTGKTRVVWERDPAKQMTLVLKNSYRIPAQNRHIRMELPRPLNTQDRGAKVSIQADERIELLHGPAGAEEPVPDLDRFEQSFDQTPSIVEIAWRPFQREIVAQATIDIEMHEHSAQVEQALRFPRPRLAAVTDAKNPLIELVVPPGIDKPTVVSGGQITYDRVRHKAWLRPAAAAGDVEVVLQYDLAVKDERLSVTPIWPADVSQKDVKVRVWAPAGVQTRLTDEAVQRGVWKERSIEVVPEKKQFPALVLVGYGANLPLALQIENAAASTLAAFLADRALIQVHMADDGRQQVQARYLIRKLNAPYVDVELPLPLSRFRDRPTFTLGKDALSQWKVIDATEQVVRVQLHPDQAKLPALLEISYTIPAEGMERNSFWRTTLYAPIMRSEVVIGQMRWQLSAPAPQIAAALGRSVRADVQWGLQGWWLPTPEPSVTGADLDSWLAGKEAAQPDGGVTFAFSHVSLQPETVYHLPRQWWLLGCSGIFLIVALGTYLAPLPRWAFWLLLGAFAFVVAAFAVLCPAACAPVLFGMQPGVVLLIVFIGMHLLMQERYRRQLVFLPGFTRAKQSSTIVRSNAAKRPREASTVDAPPGSHGAPSNSAGSQAGS